MAAPLILARTFKDAHAFAREELGLSHGYYRVVNSAGTIKAVRGVDLYLVPGWDKRPDRFTMGSAIKWCRLNVIDVAKQPVEPTDERWADTAYTRTIAERFNRIHFTETPEPTNLVAQIGATPSDAFTNFITGGVHTTAASLEEAVIEEIATCIDCGLDPHAEDCASNVLETAPEPEAPKKHRRRRKCADCEQLHFKGDPCVEAE